MRTILAAVIGFLLVAMCGRHWIAWLAARFREPIKSASDRVAELHQAKQATPTMGGLFVVGGMLAAVALLADWRQPAVLLGIAVTMALAALGAVDDLIKLRTSRRGVSSRTKLAGQAVVAGLAAFALYGWQPHEASLAVPFTSLSIPLGAWFIPLAMLTIVGTSNAVNLTDGLDGLAGGCLLLTAATLGFVAWLSGDAARAAAWGVPFVPGGSEIALVLSAMAGAVLGFLWFNCHPAQVFMGDTGALALGGLLGFAAVAVRQELLLAVAGGVFVAEAVSVIVQKASMRLRRGARVFRCAPLHHHFQFCGWPETRIVTRFWIAGACCSLVALSSLLPMDATGPTAADVERLARAEDTNQPDAFAATRALPPGE